jgi:hypothetical protein
VREAARLPQGILSVLLKAAMRELPGSTLRVARPWSDRAGIRCGPAATHKKRHPERSEGPMQLRGDSRPRLSGRAQLGRDDRPRPRNRRVPDNREGHDFSRADGVAILVDAPEPALSELRVTTRGSRMGGAIISAHQVSSLNHSRNLAHPASHSLVFCCIII